MREAQARSLPDHKPGPARSATGDPSVTGSFTLYLLKELVQSLRTRARPSEE